jgi:hypothetical protein
MYEEFIGVLSIYFLIFLIVSFCKYIVDLIFEDCPEIEMEDERKNYECGEEHSNDFISDDKICCPNITTADNQQQTFQIVFTQVRLDIFVIFNNL